MSVPAVGPELVLAVNCGSSTLKAALVDPRSGERRLTASAEIGSEEATGLTTTRGSVVERIEVEGGGHGAMVPALVAALRADERASLMAVAHRLVHGGPVLRDHAVVSDDVRRQLEAAAELAPLHVPSALAALDVAREALPDLPHVVALDTAFHRHLPEVAWRYAVPREWTSLGVRRYGFHGLSHEWVTTRAAELAGRPPEALRLVSLHLGNGCSGAAVLGGRSVDTTMGFTPLEGLVMGSRSGDVDPGALAFVAERTGLDLEGIVTALNHESGLLGLSGLSSDVRDLTRAEAEGSAEAGLALDLYCYRAAKAVAALTVPLGGLDGLVLTGGVGEHSARVRTGVAARLGHLGVLLDAQLNAVHGESSDGRISVDGTVTVRVVPTDEERVMARAAVALLTE